MPTAEQFNNVHARWESQGRPPCQHTSVQSWRDDPGDPVDGVGCTTCGRWFADEWEAKRHAASGVAR
jgi:hypothetical protein